MPLRVSIIGALITEDIAKLEAAFESIAERADAAAEAKVATEIQLEIAKAKAIFAQYKPKPEAELAKVADEIRSAEYAVEVAVKAAEDAAIAAEKEAAAKLAAVEANIKGKVKKFVRKKP